MCGLCHAAFTKEKVPPTVNAMKIINVSKLQPLFSLLNDYGCFLSKLSKTLQPLHELLQKDKPWKLLDCKIAAHYDTGKPLKDKSWQPLDCKILVYYDTIGSLSITSDTSQQHVGEVLSHVTKNRGD